MKNIRYTLLPAVAALFLVSSCSEEKVPVYDSEYAALNIWVGNENTAIDSTTYNYSYALGEAPLTFYARVIGQPAAQDRTFRLEAYDGDLALAEGSYRTEEYVLKAGEITGEYAIYFDTSKLKDAASFSTTDGRIRFRLVEDGMFAPGNKETQSITVVLKNYLAKPETWDSATYPNMALLGIFGVYSKVKYQFMIQELGLVDFSVSYYQTGTYDEATNTLSYNYALFLKDKLKVALAEYNKANGSLMDETGNPVTF